MKPYRPTSGPYREALHFETHEIETICTDALANEQLLPTTPSPIRIDRFITKHFHIDPTYEDLPTDRLGYTDFNAKGQVIKLALSKALGEDTRTTARRRERTTIAHEAGHGLLHAILHIDTGQTSMLPTPPAEREMCRDTDIATRKSYKWYEYQANLAIGGLLLPKQLAMSALAPHLTTNRLGATILTDNHATAAVESLAEIFDVNPIVAKIRIETLLNISIK